MVIIVAFNTNAVLWLCIAAVSIWSAALTYLLLKTLANYNRLTRGTTDKTLSEVLSRLLGEEQQTQAEIKKNLAVIAQVQKDAKDYVQKIGVVRFNPFTDTGGDQSFSLALLDGHNNGVILTSFYARTGVRWYIKNVKMGKGVEHELSNEEKEALKKALRLK